MTNGIVRVSFQLQFGPNTNTVIWQLIFLAYLHVHSLFFLSPKILMSNKLLQIPGKIDSNITVQVKSKLGY